MRPRPQHQRLHGQNQGRMNSENQLLTFVKIIFISAILTQSSFQTCVCVFDFAFLGGGQNGTADAASMSADDIYAAGLCYNLELAAGESYNGVGRSLQRTHTEACVAS